jgi:quinohemoprotein ethanol dehydrogenase
MSTAFNKLPIFIFFLLPLACGQVLKPGSEAHIRQVISAVDHQRIVVADNHPEDWLTSGRNYSEDRYSELDQITKSNINELGLAWSINLGVYSGIKSTPIVSDGIMFMSGPWSKVYAIDVRKGEIIWIYDPEVPREYGIKVCCDVVNRGVSMYKGMIYVGTLDGRLVAIEAATGKLVWETLTVDQNKPYSITGGTRVFDGKVLIGNSGGDYGVRGYVTAYDAFSGEQIWRFYTVPGNPAHGFESEAMEEAASTWTGEWWTMGGGGAVLDAIVYDPELKLVYIGTGNGSTWNGDVRSPGEGDKLYLSSIVALHLESGEMEWYYQQIPGEAFDFTATQPIILADLEIEAKPRKVLMQAPKNGFFYVLDRTNGELISAEPYVHVNWASHIDMDSGRPVEHKYAPYTDCAYQMAPTAYGGHNWLPMSYNRETGLVYLPVRESFERVASQMKVALQKNSMFNDYGKLLAWDPIEQKEVWSVRQVSNWNGGVLSTRDLVFQGDAKGIFRAFDADSGKKLWSYDLGTGIMAAPNTYMVDGVQYVSIAVGWGSVEGLLDQAMTENINPGTVYTFALGKKEAPPVFK